MEIQYEEEWPIHDMKVLESTPSRLLTWDRLRMKVWDKLDYWVILMTCPVCKSGKYHGYPCPVCDKPKKKQKEKRQIFSGERRARKRVACACGCGEVFMTSFPDKVYKNTTHRMRGWRQSFKGDAVVHKYTRKTVPDQIVVEQKPEGYVYLMKSGNGYHKIGISKNVEQRLYGIRRNFPVNIEIVHYIKSEDYRSLERLLHKKFADKRVEYEWFKLDREDVEWIMSLQDYELDEAL